MRNDTRAARTRELALALVEHVSVTGTPGEASFPGHLRGLLADIPYFRDNPGHLRLDPVPGFPEGRHNLFALVRGPGARTVVLCGHFDVVGIADYADLQPLAGQPEALRDGLLGRDGGSALARADLASGDFLPGRGLLDMKSGLAAGMAVLESFAADPARQGNLLLVACPDEENQSAGMRAAGPALAALAAEHGLDLRLMINLDALQDDGDGSAGRMVGLGCIGKHLLTAYVVGRATHACYPFNGVNASYLAGEILADLESTPELAETHRPDDGPAETCAPPALLISADDKEGYDVTTPAAHWMALNVITQRRSASEVLSIARSLTQTAVARGLARLKDRARALGALRRELAAIETVPVHDFAAVRAAAESNGGEAFRRRFAAEAQSAEAAGCTLPEISRRLTARAWRESGLPGPAVVLGFGSLSYPAAPPLSLQGEAALERLIRDAVTAAARSHGTSVGFCDFLPIICDMSFGARIDAGDYAVAARNNPAWGPVLDWRAGDAPPMPAINIGPWGRDYHHHLERVHQGYAFEVLPDLIEAAARAVLGARG